MPPQQHLDHLGTLLRQVAASNRLAIEEFQALQGEHPGLVRFIVEQLDRREDVPFAEKLAAFRGRCATGDVTASTLWGVL